jgi:DNA-directed RNA polymerase specialized sigma24 family protein
MEVTTRMARQGRAEVLASVAAGDEVAFRHVIAAHHEDMRRVCLVICGDHAIADEATQAAWFIAWKKIDKVYDLDRLRPWLVSVAANEAKKLMTKRRRRAQFETALEGATEQRGVDPATASRRSTSMPRCRASMRTTALSSPCATSLASTPTSWRWRSASAHRALAVGSSGS